MKYIDLLNRFWKANKQQRFTTSERELYFFLLNEANSAYWEMPFCCPTSVISAFVGLSRASLTRAREGLTKRGFISFTEGVRHSRAPSYTIVFSSDNETTAETTRETTHETIIKDKEKHHTKKDNTLRPIGDLAAIISMDDTWIDRIIHAIQRERGCCLSEDDVKSSLEAFVQGQLLRGVSEKTEEDCRIHFYNWLKLHISSNNSKESHSNYGYRNETYDKRRGYNATHASAEEFEAPFPTVHGDY